MIRNVLIVLTAPLTGLLLLVAALWGKLWRLGSLQRLRSLQRLGSLQDAQGINRARALSAALSRAHAGTMPGAPAKLVRNRGGR
jgi:hypothetical protein